METCDGMICIKKTVFTFLQQNVGGDDTFRPACAFVNGNAVAERIGQNSNGRVVMSIVVQIEVHYYEDKFCRRA